MGSCGRAYVNLELDRKRKRPASAPAYLGSQRPHLFLRPNLSLQVCDLFVKKMRTGFLDVRIMSYICAKVTRPCSLEHLHRVILSCTWTWAIPQLSMKPSFSMFRHD
jgi:hypothetical protein